jgi:methylenetetrahydrofolate reductase (NADPH)
MKTQQNYAPTFSFEFFPPRTEQGAEKLRQTWAQLARLEPRFFSVTFGAGGSTREHTFETVLEIQRDSGIEAAPHLSCIGSTRENIRQILEQYRANGIRRLVALRGDLPSGTRSAGEFRYANELIEFIRAQTGDHFTIEVACYPEFHPQADNAEADLVNFKRKVDAGADAAITQYFYNSDAYFRFVDACERQGVDLPIVPGIMPITNYKQLARFSDACGAEIPRWLRKRLEAFADDRESIVAFGIDFVSELCQRLLDAGSPGLHFYTMNQAPVVDAIWANLRRADAAA